MTDVQSPYVALELLHTLDVCRITYRNEHDLQQAVQDVAEGIGLTVQREVRLNPRDRIDLLIGRIGVEVKVDGAPHTVARQLLRYAESDQLDVLLLVTTRAAHLQLPFTIGGKALLVAFIGGCL